MKETQAEWRHTGITEPLAFGIHTTQTNQNPWNSLTTTAAKDEKQIKYITELFKIQNNSTTEMYFLFHDTITVTFLPYFRQNSNHY